jgi:hypothetical protein
VVLRLPEQLAAKIKRDFANQRRAAGWFVSLVVLLIYWRPRILKLLFSLLFARQTNDADADGEVVWS